MAVGIQQAILAAGEGPLPAGARWALCGGVILFLLSTAGIHLAARRGGNVLIPAALASAAAGLWLAGGFLPSLVLATLLLALLVGKVILGIVLLGGDSTVPVHEEGARIEVGTRE